jgi:lysine-specific demethylase 8
MVKQLQGQASKILELYQEGGRPGPADSDLSRADNSETQLLLQGLEKLLSTSYSKFYAYLSSELPLWLRELYTDASILKFSLLFLSSTFAACPAENRISLATGSKDRLDDELNNMVRTLDLAVILAGAAGRVRGRPWIDETFSILESVSAPFIRTPGVDTGSGAWADLPTFSKYEPFTPPVRHRVRRMESISMESFQIYLDRGADRALGPEPLVIHGLVDHWPAMTTRPWAKPGYILSRTFGGRRLVPVEVGRSYVDEDWDQKLITIGEFLRYHIGTSSVAEPAQAPQPSTVTTAIPTAPAYLAQHPLLTQLPSLRADITVPDLCYTAPPPHPTHPALFSRPELDEPQLNAWFGPPGTITPLHTDPYHNLLVQVVGRKYVRLYAPAQTPRMRPRAMEGAVNMANTSLWDVGVEEGWDSGDRGGDVGEFSKVPYVDCILEPGDTLYIPIGWWHYVRGLSVSFSVSFWWN